jgi:hypothetical protein
VRTTLDRLTAVMPAPTDPPARPPWERAPGEIGFQFPADYREFVDRYGGGEINGELAVLTPVEAPYSTGLPPGFPGYTAFAGNEVGDAFRELRAAAPADNTYLLFPEPGGLLVWARTYSGDHLFWDTRDEDPEKWPVVVWLRNVPPPRWRPFAGGAAQLLLEIAEYRYENADLLIGPAGSGARWTRTQDWTHWQMGA